jgi:flagellar hook protein FlgE
VAGVAGGGNVTFDTSGRSLVNSGTIAITLAAGSAAESPMTVNLNFSSLSQLARDNTVSPVSQDGLSPGMLESFTIGKDGTISGVFTNGMNQPIGQIALARFSNPSGLMKSGSNLLIETANSGLPQIGEPSRGSMGNITAGYLESSNVDLTTEFASMIVAQRGFQANSRIITTSDEILQELVQLKR